MPNNISSQGDKDKTTKYYRKNVIGKKPQSVQTIQIHFNKWLGSSGSLQGTTGLHWESAGVGVLRPHSCCLCWGTGSSSAWGSISPQGQAQLVKMLLPTWLNPGFNTPWGLAEVPTSIDSPAFPTCLCQPWAEPPSKPIAQSPVFQKRVFFTRAGSAGTLSHSCNLRKPHAAVAGVSALQRLC